MVGAAGDPCVFRLVKPVPEDSEVQLRVIQAKVDPFIYYE